MALREIFASYGIEFDRQNAIGQGERKTRTLTQSLQALGQVIAGAVIVRGIARFTGAMIRAADDLDKTSQQLGISAQQLQAFRHGAALAGVEASSFTTALGQLQRQAYQAARGSREAVDGFAALGVAFRDEVTGELRAPADLLRDVAEGLSGIENDATRTALAMTLMGRGGRQMLPMFAQGAAGIDAMAGNLERLGGGISQEFIDRSVEINDEMARFRLALTSLKTTILVGTLPVMNRILSAFTRLVAGLSRNRGAVRALTVVFTALGVAALGAALKAAAAWLAAGWPILLAAVALGVLYLAAQDVFQVFQGGDGILREFINELFPGMVDGLDSTDRAIRWVTGAVDSLWWAFSRLGEIAASVGDILLAPLRPAMALLGLAGDLAGGMGIGAAASRAAGRMTTSPITGGALVGVNPEAEAMRERREGADRARREIVQRALVRPTGISRSPSAMARAQTVDARSDVTINIHDAGIMTPREAAALARREVREELNRHTREISAALTPVEALEAEFG